MRINYDGNIGIGTTSPQSKLHIVGGKVYVDPTSRGGVNQISLAVGDEDTGLNSTGDGQLDIWSNYQNTMSFRTGLVGVGTTSPEYKLDVVGGVRANEFIYTSDVRLKKNIETISDPFDKIVNLRAVSVNWKSSNQPGIGLIAQEVEKVFPELVSGTDIKSVQYGNLVAPLIEAIKEQQSEIKNLQDRLLILEKRSAK
jgi:hypothetical protein